MSLSPNEVVVTKEEPLIYISATIKQFNKKLVTYMSAMDLLSLYK